MTVVLFTPEEIVEQARLKNAPYVEKLLVILKRMKKLVHGKPSMSPKSAFRVLLTVVTLYLDNGGSLDFVEKIENSKTIYDTILEEIDVFQELLARIDDGEDENSLLFEAANRLNNFPDQIKHKAILAVDSSAFLYDKIKAVLVELQNFKESSAQ